MKNKEEIKRELESFLNNTNHLENDSLVIIDSDTIEKEKYFVFFYTSKKYLETDDYSFAVGGNAPIIVDKITGEKFETGTAEPIEYYLEKYENGCL
jgi:hypothetical protein